MGFWAQTLGIFESVQIQCLRRFSVLGGRHGLSILPEVIEAIGGQLGVEDRVLDVPVAQIELDGAGVLAVVGEFESG